jgi:hypothetical protein
MKALKQNGNYVAFFEKSVTIDFMITWISVNFDKFNLNESISCSVELRKGYDNIIISGDEDYTELEIEIIEPIFSL